jgi:hypothetical protein
MDDQPTSGNRWEPADDAAAAPETPEPKAPEGPTTEAPEAPRAPVAQQPGIPAAAQLPRPWGRPQSKLAAAGASIFLVAGVGGFALGHSTAGDAGVRDARFSGFGGDGRGFGPGGPMNGMPGQPPNGLQPGNPGTQPGGPQDFDRQDEEGPNT